MKIVAIVEDQSLPVAELSDELLVGRVVRQDVAAFTVLYDRYSRPIYTMATYVVGPAETDEIVQEIFLRLWHRATQFDPARGSFRSWFMTLARHRMLDELRRRGQRQRWLVAEDIDRLLAEAVDPTVDVERTVGQREERAAILHALQTLPAEQRRVLILAYFGGFSQSAIAKQIGSPLGTVKKRIRLGLQKLRVFLVPPQVTVQSQDGTTRQQQIEENEVRTD